MRTNDDMWAEVSRDFDDEAQQRHATLARQIVLPVWPYLAAAKSQEEFETRRALVAERIDDATDALTADDPSARLAVRAEVDRQVVGDFDVLHQARVADAQVHVEEAARIIAIRRAGGQAAQYKRGHELHPDDQEAVKNQYIYRWTSDNPHRERAWKGIDGAPTMPLQTDDEWMRDHAFRVRSDGRLHGQQGHAQPGFMADAALHTAVAPKFVVVDNTDGQVHHHDSDGAMFTAATARNFADKRNAGAKPAYQGTFTVHTLHEASTSEPPPFVRESAQPGYQQDWNWEKHKGRQLLGFPGSTILNVEPGADYLMHGPIGGEAFGTVHVQLEDGREVHMPKDISRIRSVEKTSTVHIADGVSSEFTRKSIPRQLQDAGHTLTSRSTDDGRIQYVVDGQDMDLREAADRYLGGWDNAFGGRGASLHEAITHVTTGEWGVAYQGPTSSSRPETLTPSDKKWKLHVYKTVDEPNEWGGIGISVKHPDHYGKEFDTQEEATAYAVQHGLLREYKHDRERDRTSAKLPPVTDPQPTGTCKVCGGAVHATQTPSGWGAWVHDDQAQGAGHHLRLAESTLHVAAANVHTFDSTGEAYNRSQTDDNIKDGDILHVPSEGVTGYLHAAWPIAVTQEHGAFHTLTDPVGGPQGEPPRVCPNCGGSGKKSPDSTKTFPNQPADDDRCWGCSGQGGSAGDPPERVAKWRASWQQAKDFAGASGYHVAAQREPSHARHVDWLAHQYALSRPDAEAEAQRRYQEYPHEIERWHAHGDVKQSSLDPEHILGRAEAVVAQSGYRVTTNTHRDVNGNDVTEWVVSGYGMQFGPYATEAEAQASMAKFNNIPTLDEAMQAGASYNPEVLLRSAEAAAATDAEDYKTKQQWIVRGTKFNGSPDQLVIRADSADEAMMLARVKNAWKSAESAEPREASLHTAVPGPWNNSTATCGACGAPIREKVMLGEKFWVTGHNDGPPAREESTCPQRDHGHDPTATPRESSLRTAGEKKMKTPAVHISGPSRSSNHPPYTVHQVNGPTESMWISHHNSPEEAEAAAFAHARKNNMHLYLDGEEVMTRKEGARTAAIQVRPYTRTPTGQSAQPGWMVSGRHPKTQRNVRIFFENEGAAHSHAEKLRASDHDDIDIDWGNGDVSKAPAPLPTTEDGWAAFERQKHSVHAGLIQVCRHGRTITEGCPQCLGENDWHVEETASLNPERLLARAEAAEYTGYVQCDRCGDDEASSALNKPCGRNDCGGTYRRDPARRSEAAAKDDDDITEHVTQGFEKEPPKPTTTKPRQKPGAGSAGAVQGFGEPTKTTAGLFDRFRARRAKRARRTLRREAIVQADGYYVMNGEQAVAGPFTTPSEAEQALQPNTPQTIEYRVAGEVWGETDDTKPFENPDGYSKGSGEIGAELADGGGGGSSEVYLSSVRHAKVAEIIDGILLTNPSMDPVVARNLAIETVERFPVVAARPPVSGNGYSPNAWTHLNPRNPEHVRQAPDEKLLDWIHQGQRELVEPEARRRNIYGSLRTAMDVQQDTPGNIRARCPCGWGSVGPERDVQDEIDQHMREFHHEASLHIAAFGDDLNAIQNVNLRSYCRDTWDEGDRWGSAMNILGGIADLLTHVGEQVHPEIGYSPGMGGPDMSDESTGAFFQEGLDAGQFNVNDLQQASHVLHLLCDKLDAAGESY